MKVRPDRVNKAAKNGASPGVAEGGKGKPRRSCPSRPSIGARQVPPGRAAEARPQRPLSSRPGRLDDRRRRTRSSPGRWSTASGVSSSAAASSTRSMTCTTAMPPSHPELLAELAEQFAGQRLRPEVPHPRHLQQRGLSAAPAGRPRGNDDGRGRCSATMAVKVLTPEQLYDSLASGPRRGATRVRPRAARPRRPRPRPAKGSPATSASSSSTSSPTTTPTRPSIRPASRRCCG